MWVGVCEVCTQSFNSIHSNDHSVHCMFVHIFATVIVLRRRIEWKTTKNDRFVVVAVVAKNGGRAEKKPIAIIFTGVRVVQKKNIIDWLVPFSASLNRGFVCSRTAQQIGMFTTGTKRSLSLAYLLFGYFARNKWS